ncbi:MAG: permease [Candidatus Kaiserbacteria bacterium]|nr:permease [Candidatus Kaiserbacteria bacterium]
MRHIFALSFALLALVIMGQDHEAGSRIALLHTQKAVLVGHGWGGNASSMNVLADYIRSRGITAKTFDLPGHGNASGDTSKLVCSDYLKGIVAAYDELAQNPDVDPNGISVVGTSLSANLFAQLLAVRKVAVYVGDAPANYTDEMCSHPLDQLIGNATQHEALVEWRKHSLEPVDYPAPMRALQAFRGKIVVVRNELDETFVPSATTSNYAKAGGVSVTLIKGVGHGLERPGEEGNDFGQRKLAEIVVNAVDASQLASR